VSEGNPCRNRECIETCPFNAAAMEGRRPSSSSLRAQSVAAGILGIAIETITECYEIDPAQSAMIPKLKAAFR